MITVPKAELFSDILGFCGIFFLTVRFIPALYAEIKYIRNKDYQAINLYFIIIEVLAATCMMSAALLVQALPFILANLFSLIFYFVIILVHYCIKPFLVKQENKNVN